MYFFNEKKKGSKIVRVQFNISCCYLLIWKLLIFSHKINCSRPPSCLKQKIMTICSHLVFPFHHRKNWIRCHQSKSITKLHLHMQIPRYHDGGKTLFAFTSITSIPERMWRLINGIKCFQDSGFVYVIPFFNDVLLEKKT